jgi:capsular polysaccharide biosynthesis protein
MEQQIKESSDEINLYDLWKVIVKRKRLIIGLFLVVVILTTIISFLMPKIYRGEAVLNVLPYEAMPPKEITDTIGNIDKEKRAIILPKTNSSVTDMKLKVFKDSKDKIGIIIDSKNVDDIPKALSELVDYINNIDVVKLNVKEEKERLLKRSAELSDIVQSSSDLSITYLKLLKSGKLLPMGFNPVDLNKRIADIKLEKLGVEQSIQRLKDGGIGIAAQPYIPSKPVKPKKMLIVALAGAASLFIGIFIAFFMEYIKKINGTKGI